MESSIAMKFRNTGIQKGKYSVTLSTIVCVCVYVEGVRDMSNGKVALSLLLLELVGQGTKIFPSYKTDRSSASLDTSVDFTK